VATRRRKKSWLMELILGKPTPKRRRSSSGRRKAGSHPLNLSRRYQRWAATVDTNRAGSLKEKNDLKEARAKALLERDKQKARARKTREAKAKERATRMAAAQQRRAGSTQPTTRTVPAPRPTGQRRPTAAEVNSTLCGARCDDGTPCENPTTGGPCSAGHNPKAKPRVKAHRSTTTRRPGETDGQFVHRGRTEAMAGGRQTERPLRTAPSPYATAYQVPQEKRGPQCGCCRGYHGKDPRAMKIHCDWCQGHTTVRSVG
jgi:hypothetical protein